MSNQRTAIATYLKVEVRQPAFNSYTLEVGDAKQRVGKE